MEWSVFLQWVSPRPCLPPEATPAVGLCESFPEGIRTHIFFLFVLAHWVVIAACGLPLVAGSGGYAPAVVLRSLTAVASLVVECEL